MLLIRSAVAGAVQRNDIFVRIARAAAGEGIRISLQSPVAAQFGQAIEATIRATLADLGIDDAAVEVEDQGALDFAIRARVVAAVRRARGDCGDVS
jgi:citrate lyase subunit gamma (acyl carrier protein)